MVTLFCVVKCVWFLNGNKERVNLSILRACFHSLPVLIEFGSSLMIFALLFSSCDPSLQLFVPYWFREWGVPPMPTSPHFKWTPTQLQEMGAQGKLIQGKGVGFPDLIRKRRCPRRNFLNGYKMLCKVACSKISLAPHLRTHLGLIAPPVPVDAVATIITRGRRERSKGERM